MTSSYYFINTSVKAFATYHQNPSDYPQNLDLH